MVDKCYISSRYEYIHEKGKWDSQTVDIHHVVARKKVFKLAACFPLVFVISVFYTLLGQDKSAFVPLLYLVIGALFIRLLRRTLVKRESVVIIPGFGVQLETHYRSGRDVRRFVPIDKILKPLLNECVTPVTCYWSLALILSDEDELMLVFGKLRPPLKMLVPIWKALCASTDSGESLKAFPDAS